MANLRVEQDNIQVLKVEIFSGLKVERSENGAESDYVETKSSILGAPCSYFVPKEDNRHFLDVLEEDHKPYLVAVTTLITSPMKLYV